MTLLPPKRGCEDRSGATTLPGPLLLPGIGAGVKATRQGDQIPPRNVLASSGLRCGYWLLASGPGSADLGTWWTFAGMDVDEQEQNRYRPLEHVDSNLRHGPA